MNGNKKSPADKGQKKRVSLLDAFCEWSDKLAGISSLNYFFICAVSAAAPILACHNPLWTDKEGARQTLETRGYTQINVGGYSWLNGSGIYDTKFKAVDPAGNPMQGVVSHDIGGPSAINACNLDCL